MKYVFWILRLIVAIILVQTLWFKFKAHPDSVHIFSAVGLEPYGRIGIGILELIAAIMLLIPRTVWVGALLTVGIIAGAIFMHLTKLGIDVNGDGGTLFYLAIITFVLGLIILWMSKDQLPIFNKN